MFFIVIHGNVAPHQYAPIQHELESRGHEVGIKTVDEQFRMFNVNEYTHAAFAEPEPLDPQFPEENTIKELNLSESESYLPQALGMPSPDWYHFMSDDVVAAFFDPQQATASWSEGEWSPFKVLYHDLQIPVFQLINHESALSGPGSIEDVLLVVSEQERVKPFRQRS